MRKKDNKLNQFKMKKTLFAAGVGSVVALSVIAPLAIISQNKTTNNNTIFAKQYSSNSSAPTLLLEDLHDSPELLSAKIKAINNLDRFISFLTTFNKPNPGKSKTRDAVLLLAKHAIKYSVNIEELHDLTEKAKKDWTFALGVDNIANPVHSMWDFLKPTAHPKKEVAPVVDPKIAASKIKAKIALESFVKRMPDLPYGESSKREIEAEVAAFESQIESQKSIMGVNTKLAEAKRRIRQTHDLLIRIYAINLERIKNEYLTVLNNEQKRINELVISNLVDGHEFSSGAPLSGELNTGFANQEFGIDINQSDKKRDILINYLRTHGQIVKDDDSWQKLTIPSFSLYIDDMEFSFPVGSYFYVNNHGHDKQVMMSRVVGKKTGPSCIYFDHLYDKLSLKGIHHFTYTYEVTDLGIKITAHSFDKPDLTTGVKPTEIFLGTAWENDVFKIRELSKKQEKINNVISSKSSVVIPNISSSSMDIPLSRDNAAKFGISNIFKRELTKNPYIGSDKDAEESTLMSKYKRAKSANLLLTEFNAGGNDFTLIKRRQFFSVNTWFSYNSQNIVMLKNNKNYYLEFLSDSQINFHFLLNGNRYMIAWVPQSPRELSSLQHLYLWRFLIDNNVSPIDSAKRLKESFIAQGQPVADGHGNQKLITDVITYDWQDNHVIRVVHKVGSYFKFGDAYSENNVFIGTEEGSIRDMLSHKYAKYFNGDIALGGPKFVYTYHLTNNSDIEVKVHRFDKEIISPVKVKPIILPIILKKEKNDACVILEKLVTKLRVDSLLSVHKRMMDKVLAIHKDLILNSDSISKINEKLEYAIRDIKLLANKDMVTMLTIHQSRVNHLVPTKKTILPKGGSVSKELDVKTAKQKFGLDLDNMKNGDQRAMRDFIIQRLKFLGQEVKNDDSWQTLTINASIYFDSIKKIIHFPIGTKFYVNNEGTDRQVGFGDGNFKLRLVDGQATITSTGIHPDISVHSVYYKYTYTTHLDGSSIKITAHLVDRPDIISVVKPTSIFID